MSTDDDIQAALERLESRQDWMSLEDGKYHPENDIALVCKQARLIEKYKGALEKLKRYSLAEIRNIAKEALEDD